MCKTYLPLCSFGPYSILSYSILLVVFFVKENNILAIPFSAESKIRQVQKLDRNITGKEEENRSNFFV